jgi:hypothetical protein
MNYVMNCYCVIVHDLNVPKWKYISHDTWLRLAEWNYIAPLYHDIIKSFVHMQYQTLVCLKMLL